MGAHNLKELWPNWKIVSEIGRGSFGVVYRAVNIIEDQENHYSTESEAAIKVIRISPSSCKDLLEEESIVGEEQIRQYLKSVKTECLNEINALNRLKGYNNIVAIEDQGVIDLEDEYGWEIVIRMQLMRSFSEFAEQHPDYMKEKNVIEIGIDISRALMACEKFGIIHRDVKPANIFFNDKNNQFCLGDFGIARSLEKGRANQTRRGTMNFISPEVYYGRTYDTRADQYSLGVVLYRFLNDNRQPLQGIPDSHGNHRDYNQRRLAGEKLPPPSRASAAMSRLILKACAYDPQNRFPGARELYEAFMQMRQGTYRPDAGSSDPNDRTEKLRAGQRSGGDATTRLNPPRSGPNAGRVRSGQVQKDYSRIHESRPNQTGRTGNFSGTGRTGTKKTSKKGVIIAVVIAALLILAASGYYAYEHWLKPQNDLKAADEDNLESISFTAYPRSAESGVPIYEHPDPASKTYKTNMSDPMQVDAVSSDRRWGRTSYGTEGYGYIALKDVVAADQSWPEDKTEQPALSDEQLKQKTRYIVKEPDALHVEPDPYALTVKVVSENDQVMVMAFRKLKDEEWAYACWIDSSTKTETDVFGWIYREYLK